MKKYSSFKWENNSPPPVLPKHSIAKLKLIEEYLFRYFNTVAPDPRSDRLQISLIDGFCGGGVFRNASGAIVPGTPLIMLESIHKAEKIINKGRRKKLHIDARFYFVDKSAEAIEYLKGEIFKIGLGSEINKSIFLICDKFESVFEKIESDILQKARAGRSIFLLDQFGYKQVPLQICRQLFETLPKSEVILTFAIDWLIDYMSENSSYMAALAPIEISEQQIKKYISTKGQKEHRYIVQRLLKEHLRAVTAAPYFTPFFIRSAEAGRDLWLIHLSKHPTARNVMTSSHWTIQNASIHQGKAGLHMLGFDPHWDEALPLDFNFDGDAEAQIGYALMHDIPYRVERLDGFGAITFDAFQSDVANDTAARIDQLQKALMNLHKEGDIEIITPSGQLKRPDAALKNTDRIRLSRQLILPGFKL